MTVLIARVQSSFFQQHLCPYGLFPIGDYNLENRSFNTGKIGHINKLCLLADTEELLWSVAKNTICCGLLQTHDLLCSVANTRSVVVLWSVSVVVCCKHMIRCGLLQTRIVGVCCRHDLLLWSVANTRSVVVCCKHDLLWSVAKHDLLLSATRVCRRRFPRGNSETRTKTWNRNII